MDKQPLRKEDLHKFKDIPSSSELLAVYKYPPGIISPQVRCFFHRSESLTIYEYPMILRYGISNDFNTVHHPFINNGGVLFYYHIPLNFIGITRKGHFIKIKDDKIYEYSLDLKEIQRTRVNQFSGLIVLKKKCILDLEYFMLGIGYKDRFLGEVDLNEKYKDGIINENVLCMVGDIEIFKTPFIIGWCFSSFKVEGVDVFLCEDCIFLHYKKIVARKKITGVLSYSEFYIETISDRVDLRFMFFVFSYFFDKVFSFSVKDLEKEFLGLYLNSPRMFKSLNFTKYKDSEDLTCKLYRLVDDKGRELLEDRGMKIEKVENIAIMAIYKEIDVQNFIKTCVKEKKEHLIHDLILYYKKKNASEQISNYKDIYEKETVNTQNNDFSEQKTPNTHSKENKNTKTNILNEIEDKDIRSKDQSLPHTKNEEIKSQLNPAGMILLQFKAELKKFNCIYLSLLIESNDEKLTIPKDHPLESILRLEEFYINRSRKNFTP